MQLAFFILYHARPNLFTWLDALRERSNRRFNCRRVKLFEGDPVRQALTYVEAVRTVDPMKAVGKPHTLWVAFARMYENHNRLDSAEEVFKKATQVNYKAVDHLASVWCEWAEMELRHKNFPKALELMRQATAVPSVEVKRRGNLLF